MWYKLCVFSLADNVITQVQPAFDPEVAFKSVTNGSIDNSNTTSSIPPSPISSSNASSASSASASASRTTSSSASSQTSKQASPSAFVSVQDTVPGLSTRIGSFATDGVFSTYTQAPDSQSTILSSSSNDGNSNSNNTASSTDALGSEKKGGNNAGAIAGGVIGGLILLAILGAALVWWLRRRRRSRIAPSAAYLATYGATRPRTSLSTHPFAARTESIAMSQNNSNSVSSYHVSSRLSFSTSHCLTYVILQDEEVLRDSLYSNAEKSRYMHVPMTSPAFRGS